MTKPEEGKDRRAVAEEEHRLDSIVGDKADRRARARLKRKTSVWFGLGMYGVVGWSIALPTLIGIALGLLLDALVPTSFSWALALLFAGLILGLSSAWSWIAQEMKEDDRKQSGGREHHGN